MGMLRGVITLMLLVSFIALTIALFANRFRHRFDAAARLPLEDDDHLIAQRRLPIEAKREQ